MVVRQADTDYRTSLIEIFEAGVAEGAIVSEDPAISARVVFSVAHAISRWYRPDRDPNPAVHYAEKFFKVLVEGLGPDSAA